ncbi:hypothetical protein, partial [Salmonella enterica]|uniref:hypothetical protein n=1 Tax=Salmonella enterica TaxID=28901 RepID=UPI001112FA4B
RRHADCGDARAGDGGARRPAAAVGQRSVTGGGRIARWCWREWGSPSLIIVWLAWSRGVACVLALGSISGRMEKGLSQQSREFMA